MQREPLLVFAGDRDISVKILSYLLKQGIKPQALIVNTKDKGSHSDSLIALCNHLDENNILIGDDFRREKGVNLLKQLCPDYILSIHYPYIYPASILKIPTHGVLNLHPAYLPFNRGWNTSSWAILEGTPYGATLHFMTEELDGGDIIHQRKLNICPDDTAHLLYQKVKELEFEIFCEAWPSLANFTYSQIPQTVSKGTLHLKKDLSEEIRKINLDESVIVMNFINKLRALSTNKIDEAAYFDLNGNRYLIKIEIIKDVCKTQTKE